jgi:hypothetical protein
VTSLEGKRFMHAWCEFDDKVVDLTTAGPDMPVDKAHWYPLVDAEPLARYTAEEACINSIRHGHWGPWGADDRPENRQSS